MPSYYRDRRPRNANRYEVLRELRKKEARSEAMEDFFMKAIAPLLPTKRISLRDGYSETRSALPNPKKRRVRFIQLMYELRRDGLVEEKSTAQGKVLSITSHGLSWLSDFARRKKAILPKYSDDAEKQDRVTIVSYDVPEKLRMYRGWLRESLAGFGFKAMQRSVFIGKIKLPADFVADITRFKLEKYVEIFEITKTGTLHHKL